MGLAMKSTGWAVILGLSLLSGCGDDNDKEPDDKDGGGQDAGNNDGNSGGEDAGNNSSGDGIIALDPSDDVEAAANSICALAPWVLGKLTKEELPSSKITHKIRTEQSVFVEDKPPVCVDDADGGGGMLCDEQPTGATVFTYVYVGEADAASAVDQVWCKSENYSDLARIPGAEGAKRGECADMHALIVSWAEAQLEEPSKRKIVYEAAPKERGSEWVIAMVETRQEGDTLTASSPELYVDTKEIYVAANGTDALPFVRDDFFGNHYCKLLSPAAALAWLSGK